MNDEALKERLNHEYLVTRLFQATKCKGPIPGHVIVDECKLHNKIELRAIVHRMRENGIPICSSRNGYWHANSQEEIIDTVQMLKGRAYSILSAAYRMQKNLLDQEEIDEELFGE